MLLFLSRTSHEWDRDSLSTDEVKQEAGWRLFRRPYLYFLPACLQASSATLTFEDLEKATVGRKPDGRNL